MKEETQLEEQIRSLRHEIEKLSALLAVKKMESSYPAFHKLVSEISRAESALSMGAGEIAKAGSGIVNHIRHCKVAPIAGRILLIGTVGYLISLGLEWLIAERKQK